jgi:hypothetical protein
VLVESLNHGQGNLVSVGAVESDGDFHGLARGSALNISIVKATERSV